LKFVAHSQWESAQATSLCNIGQKVATGINTLTLKSIKQSKLVMLRLIDPVPRHHSGCSSAAYGWAGVLSPAAQTGTPAHQYGQR